MAFDVQQRAQQPQELPSFTAWLRRHGRHVRRLALGVAPEWHDYENKVWDDVQHSPQAAAQLHQCLETCGRAARQLEQLHVYWIMDTPLVVGWAPMLPPSLRELGLFGNKSVHITRSLHSLTQLTKLMLWSIPNIWEPSDVLFDEHGGLPPSIRTLALCGGHWQEFSDLPKQAS